MGTLTFLRTNDMVRDMPLIGNIDDWCIDCQFGRCI